MNQRNSHAPARMPKQGSSGRSVDQQTNWQRTGQTGKPAMNGSRRLERRLLTHLLSWVGAPPLTVSVAGGEEISARGGPPLARVRIRDLQTLWKLALDPLYQFGEAYASGRIEVDGDLTTLLIAIYRSLNRHSSGFLSPSHLMRLLHRRHSNTLSRSRRNIAHHYDLRTDFYQLWLDERLVYTCGYFPQSTMTLQEGQLAKMDYVCRKLRLQPGQSVLEAGCGWGALALYMAQHYGVTVKAFNISREQITYARQQAHQYGLDDRIEFIEDDWRNMHQQCDTFVSVGMLEHVGAENYNQFGRVIERCLKPNGFGLIHTIGQNRPQQVNAWIERNIFPGAYAPTLGQIMDVLQPYEFSVLDVENLRLHYARTLREWLGRFEQAAESVRRMFDERFVRMWRLYLAGSIAAFETGGLQLFQVVFSRASNNQIPLTREDLYTADRAVRAGSARN